MWRRSRIPRSGTAGRGDSTYTSGAPWGAGLFYQQEVVNMSMHILMYFAGLEILLMGAIWADAWMHRAPRKIPARRVR